MRTVPWTRPAYAQPRLTFSAVQCRRPPKNVPRFVRTTAHFSGRGLVGDRAAGLGSRSGLPFSASDAQDTVGFRIEGEDVFEGFTRDLIETPEATICIRRGGSGPPLLLLHGYPQSHLMWHRVAPALADEFTVVCADLRGYGDSSKPPTTPDHEPYSKRAMARDQVAVMQALGFERFMVVGHDRGGRVAYRMALDHPDRVEKLAVLDIVPTGEMYRRTGTGSSSLNRSISPNG